MRSPSGRIRSGYNGGETSLVPGWQSLGASFGSVDDVSASFTSGLSGVNALRLNGGLAQLTSDTFEAGRVYTFTIDIGRPVGAPSNVNGVLFGFRNSANNDYLAFPGNS